VKSGDVKILEKTFSLPDVTPGSIIEYRYKIQRDADALYNILWHIQDDLYTRRAHFVFNLIKVKVRPHYFGELLAWTAELCP